MSKDYEESNLNKLSQNDVVQIMESKTVKFVDDFNEFIPEEARHYQEKPLDQWLGFYLLCLVLFEFIFAIRMLRKRPMKTHPRELGVYGYKSGHSIIDIPRLAKSNFCMDDLFIVSILIIYLLPSSSFQVRKSKLKVLESLFYDVVLLP